MSVDDEVLTLMSAEKFHGVNKVGVEGAGPSHPRSSDVPLPRKRGSRIPLEFSTDDLCVVEEVVVELMLVLKMVVV